MRIRLLPTTFALLTAACGASDTEVRDAKTSGYQTDFAIVYSETLAAVRDLYPNLKEDARIGVIKTAWHYVAITQGNDETQVPSQAQQMSPMGQPSAFQASNAIRKHFFIRFDINVVGGKPWRVRVHAQASAWKEGEVPVPLRAADVPSWLEPRREALEVKIHRRLKKYAVRVKAEKVAAPKPRPAPAVDLARYGKIPPAAAKVVSQVDQAAGTRDMAKLRTLMAEEFTYSFGDGPSADTAVLVWQADPTILGEIGKALAAGCGEKDGQVVCPAAFLQDQNFTGYRAGFQNLGGGWKMVFFVAGD
jgi:hypothetical protein